jgi:hypothetical protein
MSAAQVQREIERFLASEVPEVLCFKGKWGVGKTYSWNRYLKQAKDGGHIALKRYAYVSLFGLNSIDQMRLAIVEGTIATERIGEPVTFESIKSNPLQGIGRAVGRWRRLLASTQLGIPGARDIAALVQSLSFFAVRDQVICLDDLERKSDGLKIKDVLGLVSFLKEDRRCKVAVILNDDAFATSEKDDFDRFFEKTIDSHLAFAPTAAECAQIALPGDSPLEVTMRQCCERLEISNIRVVKRIERLAHRLRDALAECDARVLEQAYKVVTLMGWSVYAKGEGGAAPTEFIEERGGRLAMPGDEELSAEELKWGAMLDAYGFHYATEFDKVIREGVSQGYFDAIRLMAEAATLGASLAEQARLEAFHRAWRLYHDSFGDDQAEFVAALYSSFREGYRHIDPRNANSTIVLLRELGEFEKADELLALYVADRADERLLDRTRWFAPNDVTDPAFLEAIESQEKLAEDRRKPVDVLSEMTKKGSWTQKDIRLLWKVSVDEYVAIFREFKGERLAEIVRMALSLGQGAREQEIAKNVREALTRIGGENPLNKCRMRKFGIRV